jgi:phage-related protein
MVLGLNLDVSHTKAFGHGLLELWSKGAEGIARVFFCTLVGQRIVMLHCFVKKSDKTPRRKREIAEARMGTQAPAVARLERALASGKHSPSIATLRKYVKACGKQLVLRVA